MKRKSMILILILTTLPYLPIASFAAEERSPSVKKHLDLKPPNVAQEEASDPFAAVTKWIFGKGKKKPENVQTKDLLLEQPVSVTGEEKKK